MATRSLNKVQLIGNLARDPELRYTSSGTPVVSFAVATNRTYTDSSGKDVEDVEFTNIVAWSKLAEICSQLLRKGMKVFIEGRLQTSKWNDKETNKTMYRTEVVASDMIILSSPRGGSNDSDISKASEEKSEDVDIDLDSLDLGDEIEKEEVSGKKTKDSNEKEDSSNSKNKDEEENKDNKKSSDEKEDLDDENPPF